MDINDCIQDIKTHIDEMLSIEPGNLLNEAFKDGFIRIDPNLNKHYQEVFINPTDKEVGKLEGWKASKEAKGYIYDGNIYVWAGNDENNIVYHIDVAEHFSHNIGKVVAFMVYSNTIFIENEYGYPHSNKNKAQQIVDESMPLLNTAFPSIKRVMW